MEIALIGTQEPSTRASQGKRLMEKVLQKRTKIVATVGPASSSPEIMRSLILAGANVFRLNFSHGKPDEHAKVIKQARDISHELGVHVGVLQDLPGPKVRTGTLAGDAPFVLLERGEPFELTTDEVQGTAERVRCSYANLPREVAVGHRIYLQDGAITLRITGKTKTAVQTTVEFGGELRSKQGINYPDGTLDVPAVTVEVSGGQVRSIEWVELEPLLIVSVKHPQTDAREVEHPRLDIAVAVEIDAHHRCWT